KSMLDSSFPTATGSPTIEQVLGPVDADYYIGSPDINFQPLIKGVLNMWSGINVPVKYAFGHEYNFFTDTAISLPNKPALISFQGFKDDIFPFTQDQNQLIKFSPTPSKPKKFNYNSDSAKCLLDGASSYILEDDRTTSDLLLISSLNMYHIIDSLGKLTELYVDCTAGHGIDDGDDYGTGDSTKEQVWEYIIERAAVFFQAVMNSKPKANLGNSLFVECENMRKRCSQSNTSCSNTLDYCQ
ncbi:MAG TPA: hypothetical protein PLA68_14755, partial [Panacibacter sp.]|nr:hypothetical protein [Panacibacter sp.]